MNIGTHMCYVLQLPVYKHPCDYSHPLNNKHPCSLTYVVHPFSIIIGAVNTALYFTSVADSFVELAQLAESLISMAQLK